MAETTTESIPTPVTLTKDTVRLMNVDNSWNKEGILSVFEEGKDTMVYCAASQIPLYYTTAEGRKMQLESFGYCAENGQPYHVDHLAMPDNLSHGSYPIQYEGYLSLEESSKPLTEKESAYLRKEYGV